MSSLRFLASSSSCLTFGIWLAMLVPYMSTRVWKEKEASFQTQSLTGHMTSAASCVRHLLPYIQLLPVLQICFLCYTSASCVIQLLPVQNNLLPVLHILLPVLHILLPVTRLLPVLRILSIANQHIARACLKPPGASHYRDTFSARFRFSGENGGHCTLAAVMASSSFFRRSWTAELALTFSSRDLSLLSMSSRLSRSFSRVSTQLSHSKSQSNVNTHCTLQQGTYLKWF